MHAVSSVPGERERRSREVLRQRWHVNNTARKPPVASVEGHGE